MGILPGTNLTGLVLLDTAGLQGLIGQIVEQLRDQEDRLQVMEKQLVDQVELLGDLGKDGPARREALDNHVYILETRLQDVVVRVQEDLQVFRDESRREAQHHHQILEARVKQAETKASECRRETRADRELVDEHSAVLSRIDQQLRDISAETVKHVNQLKDATADTRRMHEDNGRQNDLLEELERSLCSKASEAAVEALRRDMEQGQEVLREAVKATGAKVVEQEKRVMRGLNGFLGGPSSSSVAVSRQRSHSWKGTTGSSLEVSAPALPHGAADCDTAQRAAYISHTRSLSPPVFKLGSFKASPPSTTVQSQGATIIVKPRPTAPTIQTAPPMASPWSMEPLALGIVGGRTMPVPAMDATSTGVDNGTDTVATTEVDDTHTRRKETLPHDANVAPLTLAPPHNASAGPPAPRWASSQSGSSSRPSSGNRHRASRPPSSSAAAVSDGDGRPIGLYVSRSLPTLGKASN